MANQNTTYSKLSHKIDSDLVKAVEKDIQKRVSGLGERIDKTKEESAEARKPALYTVDEWTPSCTLVVQYFEEHIRPSTELKSGFSLVKWGLQYFHKKASPAVFPAAPESFQGHFVTICIQYNSRFPRLLERAMAGSPDAGSAPEVKLDAGQILVFGTRNFVEYPTGYDGEQKTDRAAIEGADGGFAIVLVYKKDVGAGS